MIVVTRLAMLMAREIFSYVVILSPPLTGGSRLRSPSNHILSDKNPFVHINFWTHEDDDRTSLPTSSVISKLRD